MSAWLSHKLSSLTLHDIDGSAEQNQAVKDLTKEFEVSTEKLRTIVRQFVIEMNKGLERHGATGKYARK